MNQPVEDRHPHQGRIVRDVDRCPPEVVRAYADVYTALALDALGKHCAMHPEIKPLSSGMTICGPAVTSLGPDLTVRRMAIDLARPGDVLIVAAGGIHGYACFGDGTAKRMQVKGMAGAVIDGSTRDSAGIRVLGFPTFVRGVTPRNYHYPVSGEYGAVNMPVVCGGVLVEPGDLILGDDDGVVVVPRDRAKPLLEPLRTKLNTERRERASWENYPPFSVEEDLVRRGYRIE